MMKSIQVLAAATAAAAVVIDLPVHIETTYSSVELQIGTPPKPHRLLFDTGSSTAWTVNTACTPDSCPNPGNYSRQYYNASASSTSRHLESQSTIPYIDGDGVSGVAFQDVFADPAQTIEWNQTFLSVNESSWRWITADGFLGLGFSSIAENATSSLVETLLWAGKLSAPRFGLFYGTNLLDTGAQNGVLTIGGSKEDKYVDGDVVYAPLRKESPYQLWRTPLRSVNVMVASEPNATVVTHTGKYPTTTDPKDVYPVNTTWSMYGNGRAVFDTGAGRISLPSDIISAVYYNLGWDLQKLYSGEERFECRHMNASWALTFTMGESKDESQDVSFSIRGDEFLEPGSQCMPPLDDSGAYGFALVGAAFLQRWYSVFDFGASEVEGYKPRVGFGRLRREWDYLYQ